MIIFERDFKRDFKCWLRTALESIERILALISIPITMHLQRSIGSLILKFGKERHSIWVLINPDLNKWSYLAVNNLITFLNYRIYTAHEKEAIAPKFSAGNLF